MSDIVEVLEGEIILWLFLINFIEDIQWVSDIKSLNFAIDKSKVQYVYSKVKLGTRCLKKLRLDSNFWFLNTRYLLYRNWWVGHGPSFWHHCYVEQSLVPWHHPLTPSTLPFIISLPTVEDRRFWILSLKCQDRRTPDVLLSLLELPQYWSIHNNIDPFYCFFVSEIPEVPSCRTSSPCINLSINVSYRDTTGQGSPCIFLY